MEIKNYTKYGKVGRYADLLCQMENDEYLEPYCKRTGRDYDKYKNVVEIMGPFFAGDYTELDAIKEERKRTKEYERNVQEMENNLGIVF